MCCLMGVFLIRRFLTVFLTAGAVHECLDMGATTSSGCDGFLCVVCFFAVVVPTHVWLVFILLTSAD